VEPIEVKKKIESYIDFKVSRMKERIKPTIPHKHDAYYEIIFLTDGAGYHTIDDEVFEVNPPVVFNLNPGQVHCWEFSKIPKGFVCIFRDKFLEEFHESKRNLLHMPICITSEEAINTISDFDLLYTEFTSQTPNPDILRSYLNVIILKLSRVPEGKKIKTATLNPVLIQYRSLIDKHYTMQKDLSFYAEKLSITKKRLSEICKKEIGRTASSLISERIVMESKRLLKYTDKTISEIAFELNYSDPSYFVKFFKKSTNLTPGEYRGQIR
jgi:AraC-like DNA-binding protein